MSNSIGQTNLPPKKPTTHQKKPRQFRQSQKTQKHRPIKLGTQSYWSNKLGTVASNNPRALTKPSRVALDGNIKQPVMATKTFLMTTMSRNCLQGRELPRKIFMIFARSWHVFVGVFYLYYLLSPTLKHGRREKNVLLFKWAKLFQCSAGIYSVLLIQFINIKYTITMSYGFDSKMNVEKCKTCYEMNFSVNGPE